jgi:hypothetical protein
VTRGAVYGIPPEQVVGRSVKEKFEIRNGRPVLERLPQVDFIDDGPGKPVGIKQIYRQKTNCRIRQLRWRSVDA